MTKIDKKKLAVVIGLVICVNLIGLAAGVDPRNSPTVIGTEAENLEVTIYNVDLGVVKEYRAKYLPPGGGNSVPRSLISRGG